MTVLWRNALSLSFWILAFVFAASLGAQPSPKPVRPSGVTPVHDPFDIPFRRAPMGLSSRSIVVSLATNLHVAFDAGLLRAHTVWEGPPLNLYGPPFNNSATRFVCDFTGKPLWQNLSVPPWESARAAGNGFDASKTRFLGVSTKGGSTSFRYELLLGGSTPVQVQETPRSEQVLARNAVIRRFNVSPHDSLIRVSPFHGAGESVALAGTESAVAVRRETDFLLVAARGLERNLLTAHRDDASHAVAMQSERDGKGPYSVVVTNVVSGPHVRVTLDLPPSATEQVVDVAAIVCADLAEATALAKAFAAPASIPGQGGAVRDPRSEERSRATDSRRLGSQAIPSSALRAPAGDESFTVEHFPVPKDIKLLVAGMDFLPNGDLAVCTYAGEVWIVEGVTGSPASARWRRFARGLNEPGGLRVIGGAIHVAQKCELTRLQDTDADGEADLFECLSDAWGYTGNYHSYVTGPARDALGNFYILITGHRAIYDVPFMGWCVKVMRSAERGVGSSGFAMEDRWTAEGFCAGLRVPNGFGEFNGDLFMTDNQGHWIAANKLNHLQAGNFYGHPSAQPAPPARFNGDPNFTPPAVWFPYAWVRSASGLAVIADDRFGPFQGQMLVGEFQNASVVRVALEKIDGQWQGAVFPFVKGFASGVNRIAFGPDGKLYAGGLRMGHWTSIAPQPHSLDRVNFTGKVPFEIRDVRAQPDGFELSFTQPVDAASAGDAENWDATQYTYGYDGQHNAPEKDRDEKIPGPPVRVTKATVSADQRSVRLYIEGCETRHVVMVRALEITCAEGRELRHDTFHYTLNQIPARR